MKGFRGLQQNRELKSRSLQIDHKIGSKTDNK